MKHFLIFILISTILFGCDIDDSSYDDDINTLIKGSDLTVMFIGDSLTALHNYQQHYPNYTVINEGVGGNKTQDVINRLSTIISHEDVDVIILLIGVNDACASISVQDYIYNYITIVNYLDNNMDADIYCISVLPTDYLPRNNLIKQYNYWVKETFPDNTISIYNYFLNTSTYLIKPELTVDGVHLTSLGYYTLIYLYNYFIFSQY